MFTALYDAVLYKPLLNLLIGLYSTVAFRDLGIAIILVTVVVRLILYPLFQKGIRYQAVMQELQPKIKDIQSRHKGNKEEEVKALMALYREHRINPFGGFGILLIQLPVLIALYQIFAHLTDRTQDIAPLLYSFVMFPADFTKSFLGLLNLAEPSTLMVVLAAAAQYVQARMALPAVVPGRMLSPAERMGRNMAFIAPVMTIVIFLKFPAAVSLYWLVSSLFSIGQQYMIGTHRKNPVGT